MKIIDARDARIPALGFGTWQLEGSTCADRVADALAAGYRHIDTAQAYDNHEPVGLGIARASVAREDFFLTTKLWRDNLHRHAVSTSVERSLAELGTDYVDLLLVHWPNEEVRLDETFEAMLELREKGRIRHLGVSNFPPAWLEAAEEAAPLVCNQVEYHPLLSQDHLLRPLRERGMALVAYSPLAHGRVFESEPVCEIARRHERSPAQIALRWLLGQDAVAAIPKAASREHLLENLEVFDFELDDDERARLDVLARREGQRTVAPEFAPSWERPERPSRNR